MFPGHPFVRLAYRWIGLAAALLLIGQFLPARYAVRPCTVGYVLMLWALATGNQTVLTHTLGVSVLLALWSHLRVARDWHPVWAAGLHVLVGNRETLLGRSLRSVFWVYGVAMFPIWLALSLRKLGLSGPLVGPALTLVAAGYALGDIGLARWGARWRERMTLRALGFWTTFVVLLAGASLGIGERAAAGWLALAAVVAAGALGLTALAVRQARWLHPALLARHVALFTYLTTLPGGEARFAALPFHAQTWALTLAGLGLEHGRAREAVPGSAVLQRLLQPSWAQPLWIFAVADVALWQWVALGGPDTALIMALGHLGLFAVLATL